MHFPTVYKEILNLIEKVDPIAYGNSRNYTEGAVTYLSPYISRGVISTRQVLDILSAKGYKLDESQKFIQQLAWREYFQRVWQHLEDDMFEDIRHRYTGIKHKNIPTALTTASSGINAIDIAIKNLMDTGYMHNHIRMYTASIACNIGKAYWQLPSQWMYYHLLDGDLASNACSWQWVAGTFSTKQYYCNQENINRYTNTNQQNSFLDTTYESLPTMEIPTSLLSTTSIKFTTNLPEKKLPKLDTNLPLIIYTSYNLDPLWKADIKANRVLLLEPSYFKQFPVSDKVINFILDLAKNIDGLQVFTGEVNEIPNLNSFPAIYSKEHPAFKHYPGIKESRDWLFPDINKFYNSFFGFWRKCEQQLKKEEKGILGQLIRA